MNTWPMILALVALVPVFTVIVCQPPQGRPALLPGRPDGELLARPCRGIHRVERRVRIVLRQPQERGIAARNRPRAQFVAIMPGKARRGRMEVDRIATPAQHRERRVGSRGKTGHGSR